MAGKRIIVFALFAVAALVLAMSVRGGAEAQTFKPVNGYSLTSTAPGANADSSASTGIPAPDLNLEDASSINLNPVDNYTAMGLEAPIGAYVGSLNAFAAVGLLGGPCNSSLQPNFTLKNSSVDISDQLNDTSWILKAAATNPVPDSDGDGLKDYEEQYPWFLNTMLDPDASGPLLPIQPRARYAGHTTVAGFNVLVQFLIFDPGEVTAAGGILGQLTSEKGAAALIVLDNPIGEGESAPGAIADFCTPLTTTTTLLGTTLDNPNTAANEAGYIRQANPAAGTGVLGTGTHIFRYYVQSERNLDGDAFENDLDGCRTTPDLATWNPRVAACVVGSNPGDQDCDMLPSSCDNAAYGNGGNDAVTNTDQDADGYDNAQDNCPNVANGCKDSSCGPVFNAAWDNQKDRDGGLANADLGPRTDAMGDACDDSDNDGNEDGAGAGTCLDGIDNGGDGKTDEVDPDCTPSMDKADWPPSPATQPQQGAYYHGMPWAAACVGGVDADGDGFCAALEALLGSSDANGAETGAQCSNAIDDDGDGYVNDGCPRVGKFSETGANCADAISNDTPTPDTTEAPVTVNDGCPMIGGPESRVIDATVTTGSGLPSATAAASCSDGIDNDGDGNIDGADTGCQAGSFAGDADFDGVPDGSDNCPSVWNPTQTNTDSGFVAVGAFPAGDALGDACDTDDDADGFTDAIEGTLPTDPLDRCANGAAPYKSDAWALDQNMDRSVTVVGDVLKYSGKIGQSVSGTPPTSWVLSRLDLNGDRSITVVGDVLKYSGKIGSSCT
jgi:hypothetical protein